jgi:3-hydroxyacyl-[acyl-carrier-protein] dehydratase
MAHTDPCNRRETARTAEHQLPHRYPFLLVDRALAVDPGRWAVTIKNVTRNDPWVDEDGMLPPVLIAEVMAQTGGLAVCSAAANATPAVLASIDRFRCRSPFAAGDQLLVTAQVRRRLGSNVMVRASVRVNNHLRAAGEMVLHFSPQPEATSPARGE